jgi:hypothetical protein
VPVIEDLGRPGYGWQFDLQDGSKLETCAPCQIKFVRDRKNKDKNYRTLVRLTKKWRNHAELMSLKSFIIELIVAYILDTEGNPGTIEERFRRILLYIAQAGLKEQIQFAENTAPFGAFTDPVVIIDPVYSLNNVASGITDAERVAIVAAAQNSWEAAHFASAEDDNEVWKDRREPDMVRAAATAQLRSETVDVRYRGVADPKPFECRESLACRRR